MEKLKNFLQTLFGARGRFAKAGQCERRQTHLQFLPVGMLIVYFLARSSKWRFAHDLHRKRQKKLNKFEIFKEFLLKFICRFIKILFLPAKVGRLNHQGFNWRYGWNETGVFTKTSSLKSFFEMINSRSARNSDAVQLNSSMKITSYDSRGVRAVSIQRMAVIIMVPFIRNESFQMINCIRESEKSFGNQSLDATKI